MPITFPDSGGSFLPSRINPHPTLSWQRNRKLCISQHYLRRQHIDTQLSAQSGSGVPPLAPPLGARCL